MEQHIQNQPNQPRPTYIREYTAHRDGREYIRKVKFPVPGTGGKITGRPPKVISDEIIAKVKQLRADRYTFKQIHEMTGLPLTRLAQIAKQ